MWKNRTGQDFDYTTYLLRPIYIHRYIYIQILHINIPYILAGEGTANTGMIAKIRDHRLERGISSLHWTDARIADRQQAKPIEKVFRYVII